MISGSLFLRHYARVIYEFMYDTDTAPISVGGNFAVFPAATLLDMTIGAFRLERRTGI